VRDDDGAGQRWIGLAVGLSVATVLGLFGLLIYFLRRPQGGGLGASSVYLLNSGGGSMGAAQLTPISVVGADNPIAPSSSSYMQTIALPNISDLSTEAARLASATSTPYDVIVRVVGPAGSYAAFSLDQTELQRGGTAIPTGNTVIVQSGEAHKIRLLPHQAVFAKGQAPNPGETVYASATANEVGTRLYS
jgi:hypothetical protein